MTMRPGVPDVHITDAQDAEMAEYRPLAGEAVLALIFGLLSPSAMADRALWSIPMLGILFAWRALRRIRKNAPAMVGRKMAATGLLLSLLFLVAAPADWLTYRRMVRDEARQFSALWFKHLTQGEPHKAFELGEAPAGRQPPDPSLWSYYRGNAKAREALEDFVQSPLVRTLLALGPKAQVRFYDTADQTCEGANDLVDQVYAVTYEEDNEKKSFFVLVRMLRQKLARGNADWRVLSADGGVRPEEWQPQ